MASSFGTFIFLPFLKWACQDLRGKPDSPARLPSHSAHPAPRHTARCRSVSYTCRSRAADVLNALLQRQHLVIARYAATARNSSPSRGASCTRSLGEHVRGLKWKAEWIDPNPGLIHFVDSGHLVVPWKEHKAFLKEEADEQRIREHIQAMMNKHAAAVTAITGETYEEIV
jgi:hypothetical protein